MAHIQLKNIQLAYDQNIIIDDLSLAIQSEKITVLIGANGSGKSTLLKSLVRLIKPKAGSILLNNENVTKIKDKTFATQVAYLPQEPSAPSGLSVYDLVAFGRYPHQKGSNLSQNDHQIIRKVLQDTHLLELQDKAIDTLSGGQRQRAWIAMTLAQETDVILLDEPTTYLDLTHQLEVLKLIKHINQTQKKTIIMVLHELNHAFRFADEIIGLKEGKLVCQGLPSKVISPESLKKLYRVDAKLKLDESLSYPIFESYDLLED